VGEAFVDRVGLASVGLTDPVSQPAVIFANSRDRAICRSTIDDDVLEIGIRLAERAIIGRHLRIVFDQRLQIRNRQCRSLDVDERDVPAVALLYILAAAVADEAVVMVESV